MKLRFLLLCAALLAVLSAPALAQCPDPDDTGECDTVSLVVTIDTVGMTAKAELYVWSDANIIGASTGFTWDTFGADVVMDTAYADPAIESAFDLVFLLEGDDLATTNANQRWLIGCSVILESGLPGDAGGRRLWATWDFTINSYGSNADDGIIFDTLTFSGGSAYIYIEGSLLDQKKHKNNVWTGSTAVGKSVDVEVIYEPTLPTTYALNQNFPNPFNPTTEIAFDLPKRSNVSLTVYNILGQEVERLIDEERAAGSYQAIWDGSSYSSGVYFYRLEADDFSETRKMILLK